MKKIDNLSTIIKNNTFLRNLSVFIKKKNFLRNLSVVLLLVFSFTFGFIFYYKARLNSRTPEVYISKLSTTVAATRYVSSNGNDNSGSNNCLNSASPCKTIQQAINQATNDDEIRVSSGTYTSNANPVVLIDNKSLVVKGGYLTTDWNTQNPGANETKIDGQNQRKNVVIKDSDSSSNLNVTLDGFTITNGRAENESSGVQVYPTFACQTDVSSREIINVNLFHNRIVNNYSQWGLGAGVYLFCCHAALDKNIITDNTNLGTYGGGVYIGRSVVKMTGNFIGLNRLGSPWSSSPTFGHGIFVDNSPSDWSPVNSVNLTYNTISSNKEYKDDPAVSGDSDQLGDGLFAQGGGSININHSIISGHRTGVKKALSDSLTQVSAEGNLWFNNNANWENIGTVNSSYTGDPKLAGDSYHLSTCTSSAACNKFSCSFVTPYPLEAYDVDGELRPVGGSCDYGADEWKSATQPSPSPSPSASPSGPSPSAQTKPTPSPPVCIGSTNLPRTCPCILSSQCQSSICGRDDDNDGYRVTGISSGYCITAKNGEDCDDQNPKVHPNSYFYPTPKANGSWDYNCNGQVELQYDTSCVTNLSTIACTASMPSGKSGFVGSVPTGVSSCGQKTKARVCYGYYLDSCQTGSRYLPSAGSMCVTSRICPPAIGRYRSFSIKEVDQTMGCR